MWLQVITVIDVALTWIFWLPARLFGMEKCSKCTIRIRWYQFLLLISSPLKSMGAVRSRRTAWKLRVEPPDEGLIPVTIREMNDVSG